ncbi:unnamed protein product [Brassica napus]|uniref:(rape) hypothetical protein n=1 Tax=Brassica napus TaxID=3708 RepID=A0A816K0J4_BRANA|nr:unnamed protein product [Brassica napus]
MVSEQSFLGKPISIARRKIPLKYSCEEIYDRMSSGLCIFCEDLDTPGHHDLMHKGVEIIMIESDDQPIVTKSEPIVEESLVKSDEHISETMMKPDVFSESLEDFTSDLQVVDAAAPKEAQNKSVAEENMSFALGNKIEHVVGKQSQEADHVWEPGGFITKPATQSHGIESFCSTIQPKEVTHSTETIWVDLPIQEHEKSELIDSVLETGCVHLKDLLTEFQKANRHQKHEGWVKAVDLFHSVDTSCWNQFLKQQKCPKSWNFKYKHGEYMVRSFLHDLSIETVKNKKLQVVQQRPYEIRTSRDKNDVKIFSRPFGDMDTWFQEIVTTALEIGVSLECLGQYLSHDEVLRLTTKNHESYIQKITMISIPLAKETQDWSMQSVLKIQVCIDFILAALIEFGSDGWECEDQTIILVDQDPRVWEPGGVVTEHDQWKDLEKCYICGRLTSLVQRQCSMCWQGIKFQELGWLVACSHTSLLKMLRDLDVYGRCDEFDWPIRYGGIESKVSVKAISLALVIEDGKSIPYTSNISSPETFEQGKKLLAIISDLRNRFWDKRIWEPGGSSAQLDTWNMLVKYPRHCEELKLTLKLHWICVQNAPELFIQAAKEVPHWVTNEKFGLDGVVGLDRDNQMLLDGMAEDAKVILVKFDSTYSYYTALLQLELICIEFVGGKEDVHIVDIVKEFAANDRVRMRLLIWDVTVEIHPGCGIAKDYTEYINWFRYGMQDHAVLNQFFFDIEMFQVKHKWRYKPFPIVSELELKDETALGTRNEDMLSCYITGQARDVVVSLHVEVGRTIEMSQVLLVVANCYGDLTSYGEAFYISFQCYKPVQVMVQDDRNSLKEVKAHKKAVTRCLVQWKEHPPDQILMLSSLRTRMFRRREYCDRNYG